MNPEPLPALLVVTTVHAADDTRIREKLLRSLAGQAHISYATRSPAPQDRTGIAEWLELRGGRIRRNLTAARLLMGRRHDAAVVHDPELLPAAIVAGGLARRTVVVDVHEHVPAQLRTKEWLPRALRRPIAWVAGALLRLAERTCRITLAEPGYQSLFRHRHPVFANYPDRLPDPSEPNGSIVYVGDVTAARGLTDLIDATATLDPIPRVEVVGRVDPALAAQLAGAPNLVVHGRLPHGDAMTVARRATVGVSPLHDLPNYRYSLPTKVVEYLGIGIAVVASDLPGTRETIGGLPGVILYPAGDIVGLRDALQVALSDPSYRDAASANAAEVRSRYRWPHDEVVAFYRDVLHRA